MVNHKSIEALGIEIVRLKTYINEEEDVEFLILIAFLLYAFHFTTIAYILFGCSIGLIPVSFVLSEILYIKGLKESPIDAIIKLAIVKTINE